MKLLTNKSPSSAVTDVISHDVGPLTVNMDATNYTRMGWIVVLLGFCGFMLWAVFAPLDKGVPLSGTVAKESNRKTIQHPTGGIISEILVKDGDVVKAGQVLVRMNNIQVKAQADMTRSQYFTARAAEARLLAERDGRASITFPPALEADRNDPRVIEVMALQNQLFSARRLALQNELGAAEESVAGIKLQMQGIQASRESKQEQLALIKSQLDGMRDLAKDGYIARNRMLEVERTLAQISGSMSEDFGNIGRSQRQITEVRMRESQRREEFQREVRSQLVDTQRDAELYGSRMTSQDFDLGGAEVRSPVDGTVVGVNVFTRGGVVQPGFKLMEIVPTDDALIVEGQLAVNLIDKVHTGLPVEMMFSAFNANKTPHIPGVVTSVSADRFTDERSGAPYYKVRARVTPAGAKMAAGLDIRSGMPADMFIKTGERTMMSYLLKPVFDRAKTSMTEE